MSDAVVDPISDGGNNESIVPVQEVDGTTLPPEAGNFDINEDCIRTMEDLRKNHKTFYREMAKQIAMQVTNEMKKLPEKLKRIRKEAERS